MTRNQTTSQNRIDSRIANPNASADAWRSEVRAGRKQQLKVIAGLAVGAVVAAGAIGGAIKATGPEDPYRQRVNEDITNNGAQEVLDTWQQGEGPEDTTLTLPPAENS